MTRGRYVLIEVDMLQSEKSPTATEVAKVAKKGGAFAAKLAFAKEYRAAEGSKLAKKCAACPSYYPLAWHTRMPSSSYLPW